MAEDSTDQSQKTEDPTQKRLTDARNKGQVATSREVNHWFMILAATIMVMTLAPAAMDGLRRVLTRFLAQPHMIPIDMAGLRLVLGGTLSSVGYIVLPLITLMIAAALAAGLLQNGVVFAPQQLQPKLERISIRNGVQRLFSSRAVMEFLKGIAKLAIVGTVATMIMLPEFNRLESLVRMEVIATADVMRHLAIRLLIGVLSVMFLIAGADLLFQRLQHHRQMRMSRQEIREELKQSEGDPQVRSRLRQIRRERMQQRMMQAVPEASVVITNPTHYAVALKYELEEMRAPVVLAKGIDHVAQRIRQIAEENRIPVMHNPPLARALHAGVEIGDEIPSQHYKAVAEIIGYVLRLKGKLPRERAQRG